MYVAYVRVGVWVGNTPQKAAPMLLDLAAVLVCSTSSYGPQAHDDGCSLSCISKHLHNERAHTAPARHSWEKCPDMPLRSPRQTVPATQRPPPLFRRFWFTYVKQNVTLFCCSMLAI